MDYGLPDILSALFRTRWHQSGDHRNTYAVEMCLRVHRSKANTAVYVSLSRLGYVLTAVPRLKRSPPDGAPDDRRGALPLFGGLIGLLIDAYPIGPVAQSVRAHA
jgi:hypothetical protein